MKLNCRNPRCGDRLDSGRRWQLCPSCALAYRRGAYFAAVVGAVVELLRRVW